MLRRWGGVRNQGIVEIVGLACLVAGGDQAFEFLEPIEDEHELSGSLLIFVVLDHHETLAVRCNIVCPHWAARVITAEQDLRSARAKPFKRS